MAASGGPVRRGAIGGRARQLVVLVIALGWFMLALALTPGSASALARGMATTTLAQHLAQPTPCSTDTPTPILLPTPCPTTPPATPPTATATSAPAATATPKPTATTAAPPPQNGGGPPPSTGGPQPTRVILSQPTLGDSAQGGVSEFSPANLTSNGIFIFSTLGCVLGVLGLIGLVIAWITLVSDGWGPLLKALLLGNRRGKRRFKHKSQAETRAAGGMAGRRGAGGQAAYRNAQRWR